MNAASQNPPTAIVCLTEEGALLGARIAREVGGEVFALSGRVEKADILFADTGAQLRSLFMASRPIVAVMAAGAVIRILGPCLQDKHEDPPVIAVGDDGHSVVPLLGGHHGANALARRVAALLDGHAAITTAGDLRFGIALDDPPEGYCLGNPQNAKPVMAALLGGAQCRMDGHAPWLRDSGLPWSDDGAVRFAITEKAVQAGPLDLVYHPRDLAIGVGCERDCSPDELGNLVAETLEKAGLLDQAVAGLFSLDVKADEPAVHHVAGRYGVSPRFFDAATLEAQTPRLKNPSAIVFAEVGCHGVAEAAALTAAGPDGRLLVDKTKSSRATCAIAIADTPIDISGMGREQGRLNIVGIGPGTAAWRTPEVTEMISQSEDLVGYRLYLDLLGDLADGRTRHDYDLGDEEMRVRHAIDLAGQGRRVALVCSGDAGIYAMASLVFEVLDKGDLADGARRIAIAVSPGVSALQAAAARAGAPLGHDFCTISLSDLLTPWDVIEKRLEAAALGDFVIAFYNPVSRRRRTQLATARDILMRHRPADTPVILATNLGRPGESVRFVTLAGLKIDDVDMLTTVIVGSSQTRTVRMGNARQWVFTPRGYAQKDGSQLATERQIS